MNTLSTSLLKTFCIGVLGTASMLACLPPSLAQSPPLLTESNFDAPPVDEDNVDGVIGGTRGKDDIDENRKDGSCTYAAIMPSHHYSSTVQSHPTFWVYVKPHLARKQSQLSVQASLYLVSMTDGDRQTADETTITDETSSPDALATTSPFDVTVKKSLSLSKPGLIGIEIPSQQNGLNPDEIYSWLIEVECGESNDAIALTAIAHSPEFGWIRRIVGEAPTENSMDNLSYYLEQRTWIDTVDALARLTQTAPDTMDSASGTGELLLQEWKTLLSDIESQL